MMFVLLDPASRTTRTIPTLKGEALTGLTVIEVDGPVDWLTKRVAWETLELTDDCAPLEAQLHRLIDAGAEAFRCAAFVLGPAQESVYLRKQGEAVAWQAGADPALFPMLSAEAEARGISIGELAQLVITAASARLLYNAKLEAARIRAKLAVSAAGDPAAKRAAAEVDWAAELSA